MAMNSCLMLTIELQIRENLKSQLVPSDPQDLGRLDLRSAYLLNFTTIWGMLRFWFKVWHVQQLIVGHGWTETDVSQNASPGSPTVTLPALATII